MSPGNVLNAYKICIEHCGAPKLENNAKDFLISYFLDSNDAEYRFQGNLGFGGKLYKNYKNQFSVDCYSEDCTPERKMMIDSANKLLRNLK